MPGAKAPPLDAATPVQIAEAVRIGPYAMPPFPESAISDRELDAIVAYVEYAKTPATTAAGPSTTSARSRRAWSRGWWPWSCSLRPAS